MQGQLSAAAPCTPGFGCCRGWCSNARGKFMSVNNTSIRTRCGVWNPATSRTTEGSLCGVFQMVCIPLRGFQHLSVQHLTLSCEGFEVQNAAWRKMKTPDMLALWLQVASGSLLYVHAKCFMCHIFCTRENLWYMCYTMHIWCMLRCYVYSIQASLPYSTYSTYSKEPGESGC